MSLPQGTWTQSSRNAYVANGTLVADLRNSRGEWIHASAPFVPGASYGNTEGAFQFEAMPFPSGTWSQTARNPRIVGNVLHAELQTNSGAFMKASVFLTGSNNSLMNQNGHFASQSGAPPPQRQPAAPQHHQAKTMATITSDNVKVSIGQKVSAYWRDENTTNMNGWYDATIARCISSEQCAVVFDQYPQWGECIVRSSQLRAQRNRASPAKQVAGAVEKMMGSVTSNVTSMFQGMHFPKSQPGLPGQTHYTAPRPVLQAAPVQPAYNPVSYQQSSYPQPAVQKQRCFKCRGNGFVHETSMPHDKPHNQKCFFCKGCKACAGNGFI